MKLHKITPKVIDLVQALVEEGYQGTVEITNSYCTGTADVLGRALSVQLSGFCKETLHIVEEDGVIVLVGRYDIEAKQEVFTVQDIVEIAWDMYKCYKNSGYTRPREFEELFKKYGYLSEKKVTKLVEKE